MMIYHQTKFGCQGINSSENVVVRVTDNLKLHCDLDLERSNPIFQQDAPPYDAVLPNQVWFQTKQHLRRHDKNSHILII